MDTTVVPFINEMVRIECKEFSAIEAIRFQVWLI
jgi:hypothetical protein